MLDGKQAKASWQRQMCQPHQLLVTTSIAHGDCRTLTISLLVTVCGGASTELFVCPYVHLHLKNQQVESLWQATQAPHAVQQHCGEHTWELHLQKLPSFNVTFCVFTCKSPCQSGESDPSACAFITITCASARRCSRSSLSCCILSLESFNSSTCSVALPL
jgi:hypothetical protein